MICSEMDRDGDGRVSYKDFELALQYNDEDENDDDS